MENGRYGEWQQPCWIGLPMWSTEADMCGDVEDRSRAGGRSRRRVGVVAVGAAVALMAPACAEEPVVPAPAGDAVGFDVSANADGLPADAGVVEWDDDFHRVVVTTDAHPAAVVDAAAVETAEFVWDDLTDDGARSLGSPSPLLRPVPPADDVERWLLELAPPDAFIVVDDDGVVDAPGDRYLRTITELYAIEPLRSARTDAVGRPTGAAAQERDESVIAELVDLPGVVEATWTAPGLVAVTLRDVAAAEQLRNVAGVTEVTVDGLLSFGAEPRQAEQWMIDNTGSGRQAGGWPGAVGADTNADVAWEVTTGAGIVVAVVDSGVDGTHPDLAGRMWFNPGEVCGNGADDDANGFVDDCGGWDFGSTDPDPSPDPAAPMTFHGTHVAGLVAAERNDFGVVGIAPDAQIMPLKVSNASGNLSTAWVAGAIQYAVSEGADVINLSLGSQPGEPREWHAHVEAAIEHAAANGVVVVAATGNNGVDTTSAPVWPADFSRDHTNVIAVGASTNADTAANFSNRGSGLTVWAPGWWLLSTMPGGGHDYSSGTSMASPVLAGTAALVKASGLATSPDRIRTRITATAASAPVGLRVDAAAAVGAPGVPPTGSVLSVSMSGADSLVADEPGALEWVIATDDVANVAGVEVMVAARVGGVASAVEGLSASLSVDGAEPVAAVSDMFGSLGVVSVGDVSRLGGGLGVSASMSLAAADYAFVLRAVDHAGAPASDGYVTYVSLAGPSTAPVGPSQPSDGSSLPPAPPITDPVPAPGGGSPDDGGGSSGDDASSSDDGSQSDGGSSGGGGTSGGGMPNDGGGSSGGTAPQPVDDSGSSPPVWPPMESGESVPTTPGGPTAPSEPGAPTDPAAPTPEPGPTTPAESVPDTSPGVDRSDSVAAPGDGSTGDAGGAAPPPGEPGQSPPDANGEPTPSPEPDTSGEHALTSMAPRSAPLRGGVTSVLEGRFPTNTAIWVWYGDGPSSVVRAFTVSDQQLLATAPPTSTAGTRDVVVRFSTDQDHELRLSHAFTYLDDTVVDDPVGDGGGVDPVEPVGGGVGVGDPDGGGDGGVDPVQPVGGDQGGVDPVEPIDGGQVDQGPVAPIDGSPPPASSPPVDGGDSAPPGGEPGDGSPATTIGGEPSVVGQLGSTTLRQIRSDGPLAALARMVWPDRQCASSCAATRLA